MHAHFYRLPAASTDQKGPRAADADDDDHATARSLDTFTLVLPAGLPPFVLSRGPALLVAPPEASAPFAAVEERGHDPPVFNRSNPRAPPV